MNKTQQQVLEWLQSLSINQIKHTLTIKNPANSIYIKLILELHPQARPIERISHGYSLAKVNNQEAIYVREKYRYKKRKQQKMAMDKVLFENVLVSRLSPWSFSLKKSFIMSQQFRECMLLFSDQLIFNFSNLKQTPVKLGAEKQMKPIWFDPTHFKSLSEWLVYLFEVEIWETFHAQKYAKTTLNKQVNHISYAAEHISTEFLTHHLEHILHVLSEARFSGRYAKKSSKKEVFFSKDQEFEEFEEILEVKPEEKPYLLKRCLQKLENSPCGLDQAIFEYEWLSEDRTLKVNRVLKDLCRIVARKFKEFELDAKAKEIEALSQSNKKKKKKVKKTPQENQPQQLQKQEKIGQIQASQESLKEIQGFAKVQELKGLAKIETAQSPAKVQKLKSVDVIKEQAQIQQNKMELTEAIPEIMLKGQTYQEEKQISIDCVEEKRQKADRKKKRAKDKKHQQSQAKQGNKKESLQQPRPPTSASTGNNGNNGKEGQRLLKKVVRQRLNEQILCYFKQLGTHSQAIDKYRKICLELIESSLREMELKEKWELVLFGSYSIDFALRESDLDLVVLVEDSSQLSLDKLLCHFKVKQWLRGCSIVQIQSAKVGVLQFEILLACIKHPKLKEPKRLPQDVIHVDITLAEANCRHQGIRNTGIMKQLFDEQPSLKVVTLILKQLLRSYELNKPFTGGIGSFALVILAHNILSSERAGKNEDYAHQLATICSFMTDKFEPYHTLITANKNTVLRPNPKQELNIEDPHENALLNTARIRQMGQVLELFGAFRKLLRNTEEELLLLAPEQRKKMKRVFFEKWDFLFKPLQHFEAQK